MRWARDEPDARSVVVDAESELTDPLGYGDGRDSERAEGIGLPEGTGGGGVMERSLSPGRGMLRRGEEEPWAEEARRLPSLVTVRGCPSESAIPGGYFLSGRQRCPEGLERAVLVSTQSTAAARSNTVGSNNHFGLLYPFHGLRSLRTLYGSRA